MSLLLEALKKAERAKEEAQKRTREGDAGGELRLADNAPAADARRVVTRDELPSITTPLEIQSEDLRADPPPASGLSLQPPPAAPASRGAPAEAPASQRATARKVFEAKVREPNPRLPFYIAVGALGAFAAGTIIYFWIQLSPPKPLYNSHPSQPAGDAAVAAPTTRSATSPGALAAPVDAIPGLPQAATPTPVPPVLAAAPVRPAAALSKPVARAEPRPHAKPPAAAPRKPTADSIPGLPSTSSAERTAPVVTNRPAPRVNASVAAGYTAYQAGDFDQARGEYERALRDEPGNRDAMLGLAAIETRALHFVTAEALYRQLLLADPRDAEAEAGLMALRGADMDPGAAESRLKSMIAAEPGRDVLYFTLGNQYAAQARWPEAERAYARAEALDPENADYAYNVAVALEHLRRPQEAVPQYHRALRLGLQRPSSFDPATVQARIQQLSH
ncbi:MAG: tetratricopeptide repeat protein [Burkholderiales bacterium]